MRSSNIKFSLFAKPWKEKSGSELAKFVGDLGFDAIELPVRPGFQVEPDSIAKDLPELARVLADHGVEIASITGPIDERTIAACAETEIPVIRTMVYVDETGYMATEARTRKAYEAVIPLLNKYGVTIGVQNHCDSFVCNAMGLRHLVESFDPSHVAAVWDVAHCGLNGEDPELGADILRSHLCMVNLKNAYWYRTNGPEADCAEWTHYWTTGRHGLASWPRTAAALKAGNWSGVVCLTAEYTDEASVDRFVAEDIAFAKSLFDW